MIDKIQLTATEHPLITLTNNKLDKTDNYWRVYYTRQGAGVLYEAVGGCIIRGRDYLSFASTCGHRRFLMESVLLIVFVSCVVLCFVCLRPVSCVANVARVSELSILDCPSVFTNV